MVRYVHEVASYTNINNGYNIVISEKLWCSATLWSWRFPKTRLYCITFSRGVCYV